MVFGYYAVLILIPGSAQVYLICYESVEGCAVQPKKTETFFFILTGWRYIT